MPKRSGQKFSIFDVLDVSTPPTVQVKEEAAASAPPAPIQQLEWDKAEKGQLQEAVEAGPWIRVKEVVCETAQEEEEEEPVPYERPPMDLFKAIFEGSDSEEEEEKVTPSSAVVAPVPAAPASAEVDESEDDVYGPRAPRAPRAPAAGSSKRPFVNVSAADEDEWVEVSQAKKGKKGHKKKKKKDKKKKKKKRSKSDSSSSSDADDDEMILKKLAHLKKRHAL